jgi:hypothetical protein
MAMFFENKISVRGNRGSNQEWTPATLGTEIKDNQNTEN